MTYFSSIQRNSTSGTIGQNAIHNQQRAVVLNNMGLGGNLRSSPFISSFDLDAKAREYVEGSFPRLNVTRPA